MAFTQIQAVLFDLDGTLIDSAPDLGAAVDRMRVQRGMASLPMDQYRTIAGAGARGLLGVAFGMQPDHPDYNAYREEFFSNYDKGLLDGTYGFAGVAELLAQLQQANRAWGIVTNKTERFALPIAQRMPLLQSAAVVIAGDTTAHAKPHPEPLLEAARRLRIAPQHIAYVGDDKRDIDAALAAGMPAIAAAWGYLGEHDIASWGAHAIAHQPMDVWTLLNA